MDKQCEICKKSNISMSCSMCGAQYYCGEECLKKDWFENNHNEKCIAIGDTYLDRLKKRVPPVIGQLKQKKPEASTENSACLRNDVNAIKSGLHVPGIKLIPYSTYNGTTQIQIAVRRTSKFENLSEKEVKFGEEGVKAIKSNTKFNPEETKKIEMTSRKLCVEGGITPIAFHCARNNYFQDEKEKKLLLERIGTELSLSAAITEEELIADPKFGGVFQKPKQLLQFPEKSISFIDNAGIYFGEYETKNKGADALPKQSVGDIFKYQVNTRDQLIDIPPNQDVIYHFAIFVNASTKGKDSDDLKLSELIDVKKTRRFFGSISFSKISVAKEEKFLINENNGNGYVIITLMGNIKNLYLRQVSVYFPYSASVSRNKLLSIRNDMDEDKDENELSLETNEF